MKENWTTLRELPGYAISDAGRVRSHITTGKGSSRRYPRGRVLHQHANEWGYLLVTCARPVRRTWQAHRLVATAFLGEPPTPQHQVNHKNGNPRDNRAANLEWVTASENIRHRNKVLQRGPDHKGARNPAHVLTEDAIREMRELHRSGQMNATEIGRRYGVSTTTACLIVRRVRWAHVT